MAVAREPGTTVVSVGARPGEAFTPPPWEANRDVFALLDTGRPAEVKQVLVEALERYDDTPTLFYNLACAEAQLRETDEALQHLGAAIAGILRSLSPRAMTPTLRRSATTRGSASS